MLRWWIVTEMRNASGRVEWEWDYCLATYYDFDTKKQWVNSTTEIPSQPAFHEDKSIRGRGNPIWNLATEEFPMSFNHHVTFHRPGLRITYLISDSLLV